MRKLLSIGLLALATISMTSCMKSHSCTCPSGTSVSVSTNDPSKIRSMCESQSNGRCTE